MDGRRHAVRRVDDRRPGGDVALVLDEDRPARLEIADDVDVVDDLLAHVHGCAVVLERLLHRLDGALDARAVAAWRREKDALDAHEPQGTVAHVSGRDGVRGDRQHEREAPSPRRLIDDRSNRRRAVRSRGAVALFVTCLADTLQPSVGRATVTVLERLGLEVAFPSGPDVLRPAPPQRGLPGRLAAALGRRFVEVFAGFDAVVAPSGSCVAHVRGHVGADGGDPDDVVGRTWELSQFLVDRLGVVDVGSNTRAR